MSQPIDHSSPARNLKRYLPRKVARLLVRTLHSAASMMPTRPLYRLMALGRRRRVPYALLRPDDLVVQVGCARDLLAAGRSRAIHFAFRVPRGRVVLIEADPRNASAVREFIARNRISNLSVVEMGAWNEPGTLTFLSSPLHPAANRLAGVKKVSEQLQEERQYERYEVPVDRLDAILGRLDARRPRLISVTTNGAELQIIAGAAETLAAGCPYISLASTGRDLVERMSVLGYDYIGRDDRGYAFGRRGAV
jgi:FkbM family methyltransferase